MCACACACVDLVLCIAFSTLWFLCVCWQVVPDSDAHRAGLQEGDQVLSVNDVDFQDIEHSRVSQSKLRSIHILISNNIDRFTVVGTCWKCRFNRYVLSFSFQNVDKIDWIILTQHG